MMGQRAQEGALIGVGGVGPRLASNSLCDLIKATLLLRTAVHSL